MALRATLTDTARLTRIVSGRSTGELTVTDTADLGVQPLRACRLDYPIDQPDDDYDSPRDLPAYTIAYAYGFRSLAQLQPGDRVEVLGVGQLEVLSERKEVRRGASLEGYEQSAQLVDVLYPSLVSIQALGGEETEEGVKCAFWGVSESRTAADEYEELSGEAPIEHAGAITTNRTLVRGEQRMRVLSSVIDEQAPRVTFTVRRQGG